MKGREKSLSNWIVCGILILALCPNELGAALTGYLKIPDIPGESQQADHEDEIDVHDIHWQVRQQATATGTPGERVRPEVGPLTISKFLDASSPYLALASMNAKSISEIVLVLRKDSGEAHLDYLTITMTNVKVVSYKIKSEKGDEKPSEEISFNFEKITYKYIEEGDRNGAGDEHEIEYDIAAGA